MKRRFSTTPSKTLGSTSRHHSASDHAGLWLTHHLSQAIHHAPPNWLPPYTVQDTAEGVRTNRFRAVARISTLTIDWARIEAESTRLTSCIEETSIATFLNSGRSTAYGARDGGMTTANKRSRPSETRPRAKPGKSPRKLSVQNCLLHNTTTETLWKATRWRHGQRQRNILALSIEVGPSNDTATMTAALRRCFFKENPPPVARVLQTTRPPFPEIGSDRLQRPRSPKR
jgi:hypothetical protein